MAVKTWNGGGTTNNWSDGANWGGTAPVSGDSIVFGGTTRQTNVNDLTADIQIAGITFNTANWDISGNRITLTGNITNSGGNGCHIRFDMVTTAVRTISCSFQLHIEGIISGSGGGFTKTGASTLYLYANNTCTGAYNYQAGSTHLYGSNTPSNSIFNGGTSTQCYYYRTDSVGSAITSFNTGSTTPKLNIRIDGGGTITMGGNLSGNSSVTGTVDVNNNGSGTNGVVTFGNLGAGNAQYAFTGGNGYSVRINTVTLSGGSSGIAVLNPTTAVLSIGTASASFNATHTLELGGTATGCTADGIISNGVNVVSLTKSGTGNWTLSANNTYTGATTISAGYITFSGDNSSATGNTTISNGAAMEVAAANSIPGTTRNLTVTGFLIFGSGFGAANIPTALLNRVVAASGGVICCCNYTSTDFDFQTPGLTAAYFGCYNDATYTGTLTRNTTAGWRFRCPTGVTLNMSNALSATDNLSCQGGNINFNGTGTWAVNNVTVATLGSYACTVTVGSNGVLNIGSGASHNLTVGGNGLTGVLDLSATASSTINVAQVIIADGSTSGSNGTLKLNTATITASTALYIAANNSTGTPVTGALTTAASSTVTISTPLLNVGWYKTSVGTFTAGTNSNVTIQGVSGGRCAVTAGRFDEGGSTFRTVSGTIDLSAGVATLYLSSLILGYNNITTQASDTANGTMTLSTSASNHIDISGSGSPVILGQVNANSITRTASGTLTIGNCDATSQIVSTDNSTAIMCGLQGAGAGATCTGTLNLGGTLTITTTGSAIGRSGSGTANITVTNNCTLKAGAASTTWINDVAYLKVNSGITFTIDTNSYNLTIPQLIADGTGAGNVTKAGSGTWTSAVSNTFTGTMTVTGGTFAYGASNVLSSGPVVVNGGTLAIDGYSDTVGAVTLTSGSITGSSGVLTGTSYTFNNTTEVTCSAILGGTSVALTKSNGGNVIMSGANTYTGATTLNAGSFTVTGSLHSSSDVAVNNTATLKGTGTVGAVTVASGGSIAPGTTGIGELTTGNVTFQSGSTYTVDLDGTTPTFDKINSSGTVAVGSNVTNLSVNSYSNGAVGKVFTIVGAATVSGSFLDAPDGTTISVSGRYLRVNYTATTVTLTDVVLIVPTKVIPTNTNFGLDRAIETQDAGDTVQYDEQRWLAKKNVASTSAINNAGLHWRSRTAIGSRQWQSVTFGANVGGTPLFVAVSTNDGVMTSPNGTTWTSRTSSGNHQWSSVCYGNGLFVAVSNDGYVMSSPDGITWTARTASSSKNWVGVCYGKGLFVAVCNEGDTVMTSPDGVNWTSHSTGSDCAFTSVTYGNGLFVAVANYSATSGNLIWTSSDGSTWAGVTGTDTYGCNTVCYGDGKFVAISQDGMHSAVSTDGVTWDWVSFYISSGSWYSVCYGNGLFVAVGASGSDGLNVMTSIDGKTWTGRIEAVYKNWSSVCYGDGMFVAVAGNNPDTNIVMTSSNEAVFITPNAFVDANIYYQGAGDGETLTIPDDASSFVCDTGAISTLTVTMPANPVNGHVVNISFGDSTITTLTHQANSGHNLLGALTTVTPSTFGRWRFHQPTLTWYRIH